MKITYLISVLLLCTVMPATAASHKMAFGDGCSLAYPCFFPAQLTVSAGDLVVFFDYAELSLFGPPNGGAGHGSFPCARGWENRGDGGHGKPVALGEGF